LVGLINKYPSGPDPAKPFGPGLFPEPIEFPALCSANQGVGPAQAADFTRFGISIEAKTLLIAWLFDRKNSR
jgi:hypothetical protein